MKTNFSMAKILAAAALVAFTVPVPAFSAMKDMSGMKHHEGNGQMMTHYDGHGQMMDMGNMDRMGDMMGMCLEHADKMGLTDEQISKLKPIHREMQKKHAQFKADMKIAEIEQMEIMEVKDFDLEKASSAVKKSAAIKIAHQLEMLKAMKETRTILTDDQFKEMKKMMPMKAGVKKPVKKMMKKHK